MRRERTREETVDLLRAVGDYSTNYVREARSERVRSVATRLELQDGLAHDLPRTGLDPMAVVAELIAKGEPGLLHSGAPTFLGFVIGGAFPVAVATEWLTSMWDQCGALYATSPVASVIEETVASWLVELFGLPSYTSVGITSGCATANLTGLAAARHHVLAEVGWDVDSAGLFGAPQPRILVSDGCHVTVHRALRLLGLAGHVHAIDTDDQGRMCLRSLEATLAATTGPLIVCGQVGNVDSGAVDPLHEVCRLTHDQGGWVHLDAAFGMWAAASTTVRQVVSGLEFADSWATDAHKWLNVPYDCGIVMCAHPIAHRAALRTSAEYLTAAVDGSRDPLDYTPDMSRRARSLVLWSTLRHLGAELIDRCCAMARRLADTVQRAEGIEIVNDVRLNQVLVCFEANPGGAADEHLMRIVDRLQRGGTGWASPTTWLGRPTLRLSVCNWQTTYEDIDRCALAIIEAHRGAHASYTIEELV